jgi:hypothetical protein
LLVVKQQSLEDVDQIGGISLKKGQSAIEELLRYDSSVQVSGPVVCLLGSANRDPAVYPDPERLDIMRQTLLCRLSNLQLDDIEHPDWRKPSQIWLQLRRTEKGRVRSGETRINSPHEFRSPLRRATRR